MKVLSLFSGIGAFEKALKNLGANYELVNYCEIDEWASKSYSQIHNVSEDLNLWDVTTIDTNKLPKDIDLLTHGSPCQDFSIAGDQEGGDKDSGTRSSLMWETVRIIEDIKPKIIIWENVKNVLNPKHIHNLEAYIKSLNELGYNSCYQVLCAKDYGMPQNRERLFCVSIRKDIDHGKFKFPNPVKLDKVIKDFITDFDSPRKVNKTLLPYFADEWKREYNSPSGCIKVFDGECQGIFNSDYTNKRIYSMYGVCPTITCNNSINISELKGKLNTIESWRLMGFTDEDYNKASATGIPEGQLKKQAGNSIVVNVAQAILRQIFCSNK